MEKRTEPPSFIKPQCCQNPDPKICVLIKFSGDAEAAGLEACGAFYVPCIAALGISTSQRPSTQRKQRLHGTAVAVY